MAVSKQDTELFKASRKGSAEFTIVYKGYYRNADGATITSEYNRYNGYRSISDLDVSSSSSSSGSGSSVILGVAWVVTLATVVWTDLFLCKGGPLFWSVKGSASNVMI